MIQLENLTKAFDDVTAVDRVVVPGGLRKDLSASP